MDLARLIRGEGLGQEELVRVVDAADHSKKRLPSPLRVAWVNSSASASHSSLRSARIVNLTTMKIINVSPAFGRLPAAGAGGLGAAVHVNCSLVSTPN